MDGGPEIEDSEVTATEDEQLSFACQTSKILVSGDVSVRGDCGVRVASRPSLELPVWDSLNVAGLHASTLFSFTWVGGRGLRP
jgi:hypothetical protein